ncbi:unnamed protein product [Sympodiomycopsis kandeliae]
MSGPLRRLISGPKARFVQDGVDFDLAYITDRLIIMAFPAAGMATMWRNDRRAIRKFLDERHEDYWRVFNFCPRGENEYDGDEFYGRVSRYPFPDHHPPPLSMIPMVVADMTSWLAEDSRNVVVIHCKAGKGRSGTLACCYLMSLPKLPSAPRDPRNISTAHLPQEAGSPSNGSMSRTSLQTDRPAGASSGSSNGPEEAIEEVLDTSRPRRPSLAIHAQRSFSALRNISSKHRKASATGNADLAKTSGPEQPGSTTTLQNGNDHHESFRNSQQSERRNVQAPGESSPETFHRGAFFQPSALASAASRELMSIEDKLEAVFELHTSRRMKPSKQDKNMNGLSRGNRSSATLTDSLPLQSGFAASTPHLPRTRVTSGDPVHSRVVSPTQSLRAPRSVAPQRSTLRPQSMANISSIFASSSGAASPMTTSAPRTPRLSFAVASPSRDATLPRQSLAPSGSPRAISKRRSSSLRTDSNLRPPARLGLTPMGRSMDNLNDFSSVQNSSSREMSSNTWSSSNRSLDIRRGVTSPGQSRMNLNANGPAYSMASLDETRGSMDLGAGFLDEFSMSQDNFSIMASSDANPRSKPRRYGVSIPSQRRWVGYWARVLSKTDARATLDYMTPTKPRRQIRIVRVSVLQKTPDHGQLKESKRAAAKHNAKALAKLDSFAVSFGRYEDGYVDRLEKWERGARQRARAYGLCNPSARAPVLTFSKTPENLHKAPSCVPGEEAWKSRSRQPTALDWQKCADYNTAEAARKRMAQHDNEEGVGEWGVDVLSEADRVRHFNWPDGHIHDADPKSKKFKFIDWFAKLPEKQRVFVDGEEGIDSFDRGLDGQVSQDKSSRVWHHFEGDNLLSGSASNSTSAAGGQIPENSAATTSSSRKSFQNTVRRGLGLGKAEPSNSSGQEASAGFLVSPDRELCVRLHSANKAFSILPDIAAAAGWIWFIPAFEDPVQPKTMDGQKHKNRGPRPGMRTVVRFDRHDIDFAKKVTGLEAVEVEWEWVDCGDEEMDDDEDETESVSEAEEVAMDMRVGTRPRQNGFDHGILGGAEHRDDSEEFTPSEASLRTVSSRNTRNGSSSFATVPSLSTPIFDSMSLNALVIGQDHGKENTKLTPTEMSKSCSASGNQGNSPGIQINGQEVVAGDKMATSG